MPRRLALAGAALALLSASPAHAADPGRWVPRPLNALPRIQYYQGIVSDGKGHFFFDGVFSGLYRTDLALHEQLANDNVIPDSVGADPPAGEGYNHIGDISYDAAEGGRVILPMECYRPGQGPNGNGTT